MLIDSHCHLYMLDLSAYHHHLDELIFETKQAGVDAMLCVAVNMTTAKKCIDIAETYENIYCSVGSHPSETEEDDLSLDTVCQLARHTKVVAIGETGLDYHDHSAKLDIMQNRFRTHIRAAITIKKPLIIHTRHASDDTLRIMNEENAADIGGVMHCFTESLPMAKACLDLNFYISFSGIVTFKNAKELVDVARYVPLDNLLIETDSPYLAPTPFRGKQNEPKYVQYVAAKIAEIKNISFDAVCEKTSENFRKLFLNRA